jgi:hypothetical protein
MIIDCESCVMRDLACKDCVVSVLISETISTTKERQPVELNLEVNSELNSEEARVIDLLASRGMVPPLRYAQNTKFPENSQDTQARSG